MVQLLKDRDTVKNLKAARENSISHTRNNNMITVEISSRNIESWVAMDHIFKALEERKSQPRILYSTKLSFKGEGELNTFPGQY